MHRADRFDDSGAAMADHRGMDQVAQLGRLVFAGVLIHRDGIAKRVGERLCVLVVLWDTVELGVFFCNKVAQARQRGAVLVGHPKRPVAALVAVFKIMLKVVRGRGGGRLLQCVLFRDAQTVKCLSL